MALSEVNICNMALLGLGKDRINNLTDGNDRASACLEFYEPTRDALIRAFPWDFAKARKTLAPLAAAPDWGYAYQFQLPTQPKCLRVLMVNGDREANGSDNYGVTWVREGDKLLTDEATVKLLYLQQITDPTKFDALFYSLLAKRLERDIAYTVTKSVSKAQKAAEAYEVAELEAFNTGSFESSLSDVDESDLLLTDR